MVGSNGGRFRAVFGEGPVLVGMVALPPLPGCAGHPGPAATLAAALADLGALEAVGFGAALVENDHDRPHRVQLDRAARAALAATMAATVPAARVPVGLQALYDMPATVELAHAAGARFVRLDVFADAVETRWGRVPAFGPSAAALVTALGAADLLLLADVHVKHARVLGGRGSDLAASARASVAYGADALVVTGARTGEPPAEADLATVRAAAPTVPLLVGSGLDAGNAARLLRLADGAIVGTALKDGDRIDAAKARALVRAARGT